MVGQAQKIINRIIDAGITHIVFVSDSESKIKNGDTWTYVLASGQSLSIPNIKILETVDDGVWIGFPSVYDLEFTKKIVDFNTQELGITQSHVFLFFK